VESGAIESLFPQIPHSARFSPIFYRLRPLIGSGNRNRKADEIRIAIVVDICHEKAVQNMSKTCPKLENYALFPCE